MKRTVKVISLSMLLSSVLLLANNADGAKQNIKKSAKKSITSDDGNFHGYLRMHHIFAGEDNGYDKETGSTLGFGLGYGKEVMPGLKIGAEIYGVMDSGLTETDGSENVAYGQFLNETKGASKLDNGLAWGAHITYKTNGIKATLARSQFKSPLTKIQITHVPNLYEYARLDGKILGGHASLAFITRMSYGSRAAADYGLIGEKTGTAGMRVTPFDNNAAAPFINRGKYYTIEDTVGSANDSSGIFVVGYETKINKIKIRAWDFMIDDVANNFYIDATKKIGFGKGKMLKLSAQIWNQNISNDLLEANYGGTLVGVEAMLKWGKVIGKFAYTSKDEGGLLNAWGANPAYTSSIFSRNEYRSDVDAYKATLVYKPLKNLKVMLSYADYGQSTTVGKTSKTDAVETDIAIVYKPRKNIMLKLFNANRTSEYSINDKKTQNHTRLIMNYAF